MPNTPDIAHRATDEILDDLEKRIAEEYAKASRDMQKKYIAWAEQFAEQEKKQKALLEAGKITQKEYNDWRFRHEAVGKRWEAMKDVLAADLENARDIALKIAGEKMPDVYALNANFASYQIEHDARIDAGFTLYNHDTAEYLLKDTRQLMPPPSPRKAAEIAANKAMQWEKGKIQSAVMQGILQGEPPHKIAERLRGVAEMDYNASIRYARTMTTSAQNAGRYESFRRAEKLGVHLTIEWQATPDGRTRHAHRLMHGQRTTVDEPFETPDGFTIYYPADCTGMSTAPQSEIWNCFVGETKVASDCEIIRSYKHEYQGNLVSVKSASGVEFTCTPNHPILTLRGWVPAASLNESDHLIITSVGNDGALTGNGNVYHVHSSMKALHDSFHEFGVTLNEPMANFNFHGDIPTSDVEVVSEKRLLRENGNSGFFESCNKTVFKDADTFISCKSHFVARLRRIYISALRFMSRCCKPASFFQRRVSHANIHRLRSIARRNFCVSEDTANNASAASVVCRELLDGFTGIVFADDIIAINYRAGFSSSFDTRNGQVYNLQTANGYYFVTNSISQNGQKCNDSLYAIVKNCRCTLLGYPDYIENETVRYSPKMGDMSFEEWLEATPEPKRSKRNG